MHFVDETFSTWIQSGILAQELQYEVTILILCHEKKVKRESFIIEILLSKL